MLLLICALMALCPSRGISAPASASDTASITDLRDAEKGIQFLEDKLMKRERDLQNRADYKEVKAIEMKKCADLRSEIWVLRDSARALIAKLNKLLADKKKCDADIAKCAETYKVSEDNIRAAAGGISARDKQFTGMMAAVNKESEARAKKIDNLKEDLKASDAKIKTLQNEKSRIDNDLKNKNVEYNAEMEKLNAVKNSLAAEKKEREAAQMKSGESADKDGLPAKEPAPVKDESADIKKNMDAMMATAGKWETARQKLINEISAVTAVKKVQEEKIAALEKENELKTKELKAISGDLETVKKNTLVKIEKLKKKGLLAGVRLRSARSANKKLEDDIKVIMQEKRRAEKAFKIKTDDLKVRIAVLLDEAEQDNPPEKLPVAAQAIKGLSKGEELTMKLDDIFETLTDENDRLITENKATQARLKRAEQNAKAARRKAQQAVSVPEVLRAKLNKERIDMHFNLAILYDKNGLYRDAEREYLKCLRIDPKDAGVHYNIAILYDDKINNNSKAMYHYRKFLALRPMGDTAERVRDWITKLELENRLGKEMR
ncbi:MAG: tetratricopeptide repeat protein [Candidatus Omnitrophica bacterium]|nr:tetratricopeptide repeat protein [Candidatus Omnitrophota bacterium]